MNNFGEKLKKCLDNFCITKIISKNNVYKITKKRLDKYWRESNSIKKKPLLIISIPKSATECYKLDCIVDVEKV